MHWYEQDRTAKLPREVATLDAGVWSITTKQSTRAAMWDDLRTIAGTIKVRHQMGKVPL